MIVQSDGGEAVEDREETWVGVAVGMGMVRVRVKAEWIVRYMCT